MSPHNIEVIKRMKEIEEEMEKRQRSLFVFLYIIWSQNVLSKVEASKNKI